MTKVVILAGKTLPPFPMLITYGVCIMNVNMNSSYLCMVQRLHVIVSKCLLSCKSLCKQQSAIAGSYIFFLVSFGFSKDFNGVNCSGKASYTVAAAVARSRREKNCSSMQEAFWQATAIVVGLASLPRSKKCKGLSINFQQTKIDHPEW